MRRFASLAGAALIAGGATALVLFAASARAQPLTSALLAPSGLVTQADGSGSGVETTTTLGGTGSGVTTTTIGGTGSGVTTTTVASTTTTAATGGTTTTAAAAACTTGLSATVQSVAPGQSTGISGTCYTPNTDLDMVLTSDPVSLGRAHTDGAGNFAVTVAIPLNTPVGTHTLTVSGGGRSAAISIIVSSTPGAFGVTGMSWNLAVLGLALLAAGVIVLAGDRIGKQELIEFV